MKQARGSRRPAFTVHDERALSFEVQDKAQLKCYHAERTPNSETSRRNAARSNEVWIMLAMIVSAAALYATVLDKFVERVTRPSPRPWNWRR